MKGHVNEKLLEQWAAGELSPAEEQSFLAHAGVCDYCAELLGEFLEQDLVEPPAYLKDEILEKSRSIEIRTARTIRQTSRQMRLFFYSLKVGLALAVSLFVLFVIPQDGNIKNRQEPHLLDTTKRTLTEKLQAGSDQVSEFLEEFAGWSVFVDEEEQND